MKKTLLIILSFPITLVSYILLFSGNIKYSEEIIINANIERVSDLFDNPYNMKQYMDGFQNYKLISGKINEIGSKLKCVIQESTHTAGISQLCGYIQDCPCRPSNY